MCASKRWWENISDPNSWKEPLVVFNFVHLFEFSCMLVWVGRTGINSWEPLWIFASKRWWENISDPNSWKEPLVVFNFVHLFEFSCMLVWVGRTGINSWEPLWIFASKRWWENISDPNSWKEPLVVFNFVHLFEFSCMLVWVGRSGINSWEPLWIFASKPWWENISDPNSWKEPLVVFNFVHLFEFSCMLVWVGRTGINSWEPLWIFASKRWWENISDPNSWKEPLVVFNFVHLFEFSCMLVWVGRTGINSWEPLWIFASKPWWENISDPNSWKEPLVVFNFVHLFEFSCMLVWVGRSGINSWEPLWIFASKPWWEKHFRPQ